MDKAVCEKCSYYVARPLNAYEVQFVRNHKDILIDTRYCTIGGCDGSRFIDSQKKVREYYGEKEDV